MALYVDNARIPYGRMKMCHMLADSHGELADAANKLGLKPVWIQHLGTDREHFDISMSKRQEAIKRLGALQVTSRCLVSLTRQKRLHGQRGGLSGAI